MKRAILFLAVIAMGAAPACDVPVPPVEGQNPGGGDPAVESPSYESVTLTHAGFDFSTGVVPASFETSDGHTTNWPCMPTVNAEKAYGNYVWFEPFANTSSANFTKDMGAVALNAVTQVPTTWDAGPGLILEPLVVNHVYVIKCLDGYAKFLVKAVYPAPDPPWSVDVDYAYTSGATFAQ